MFLFFFGRIFGWFEFPLPRTEGERMDPGQYGKSFFGSEKASRKFWIKRETPYLNNRTAKKVEKKLENHSFFQLFSFFPLAYYKTRDILSIRQ